MLPIPSRLLLQTRKKLPAQGLSLSKLVIECCNKCNDCATKIEITTSLIKLSLTLIKAPKCKQREQTYNFKWLWATELRKGITKG